MVVEDGLYVLRQGYARRQLVALCNYYQRLTAPEGSAVAQLRILETAQPSARLPSVYDRLSGRYITLVETAPVTGLGAIPAGAGIALDVTGHSLGAHLTLGFARLFPGVYRSATTFNAPGYEPVQEVDDFFRAIGGAAQFPLAGVTNLDGLEGPLATNLISDLRRRPKPGGRQFVFIEDQIDAALGLQLPSLAFNHSQSLLTDSMGLYARFEQIDAALGIEHITSLLKAASNRSPQSLEAALDGLRALFRVPGWDTPTAVNKRETYFTHLFALDDLLAQNYPDGAGSLLLVGELDQAVIARRAKESGGTAYRYALRALNPYVLESENPLPAYSADAGAISLAGPGESSGGMSGTWIDKRSELIVRLAERNAADRAGQLNVAAYAADPVDYRWTGADGGAGSMRFAFGLFAADDTRVRQVAFGSGGSDGLKGSNKDDSLFGEAGSDTLTGLGGIDYLEGGAGNDELNGGRGDDVLDGGTGFDTYVYALGDGQDRIIDADRSGRIVLDTGSGRVALGLLYEDPNGANVWRSADGSATLTHNSPWTISFADGGAIVLGDVLEAGDFSLTLGDAQEPAGGYVTVTWADSPYLRDFPSPAERLAYFDAYQARLAANTLYLGSEDSESWYDLYGSNRVELGGGLDVASLGGGKDIVIGGEGVDAILGGGGGDRLYGGEFLDLASALASAGEPSGEIGDMLADRSGDDWLTGSPGDDLISGGSGNDLLIGGPGDDHIYGDDYFPNFVGMMIPGGTYVPPEITEPTLVAWSFREAIEDQDFPLGMVFELRYLDAGSGGRDEIHGGSGNDWIKGGSGDDVIHGDAGDDYLVGGEGSDAVFGGDGDDQLRADLVSSRIVSRDADYLDGGAGDDYILGNNGDNVIFGGAGNDEIYAGVGHDFIDGGEGDDIIDAGIDEQPWTSVVHGGAGNDIITAAGEVYGDEGDDEISGLDAGDRIYGGAGNDVLGGRRGVRLDGGEGDDVYSLLPGAGTNYVTDASGFDTVELQSAELAGLADLVVEDSSLRLALEDGRFVLYYGPLGDRVVFLDDTLPVEQVRIVHELAPGEVVVSIIPMAGLPVFSSGTENNDVIAPGTAGAVSVGAGAGDDLVFGTAGADELRGEGGNDTLIGGAGGDTYYFVPGGGQDRIIDTGGGGDIDRLVLEGMLAAEVSVFSSGGFLFLLTADPADEITIDWDPDSYTGIERVMFADATEWDGAQLLARAQPLLTDAPPEVEPNPSAGSGGGGSESGGASSGESAGSGGQESPSEGRADSGTVAGGDAAAGPESGSDAAIAANAPAAGPEPQVADEAGIALEIASEIASAAGAATAALSTATLSTRPRSTSPVRGSATAEAVITAPASVAAFREPTPIEAFFSRVTPPPMPQQQWLDNWLPSGARAAAAGTGSGAPGASAPSGDAPSAAPPGFLPASPALPPNDTEARDFTPDEIALRYDEIDAWLAAHDGADPDELSGAGPAAYAVGSARGAGLGGGVAPLENGIGVRIGAGGFADLSAGALRPFSGLDEGFRRLG